MDRPLECGSCTPSETLTAGLTTADTRRAQLPTRKRPTRLGGWLILPPALYFAVLFVVPLVNLVGTSFRQPLPDQIRGGGATLGNYHQMFSPFFLQVFWTTLRIALLVTVISLLIGYPLAYFLARTRSRFRGLFLAMTMAPILVSVVVRAYGWLVLLVNKGLVNEVLIGLHVTKVPIALIFNETGVIIGTGVNVTVLIHGSSHP